MIFMKNLTCDERMNVVNGKIKEVLQLISLVEQGDEVDFNEITAQILDIHRDEMKLIKLLQEHENRKTKVKSLDVSGIYMVNSRGA